MNALTALTTAEIAQRAPQVYTQQPIATVSEKYTFLPTFQIVEDMAKLGWQVSDAKTMKSTNATQKQFGKHMVVFFNPEIYIKDAQGEIEAYPQILIQNNARGWGKLKFSVGIFRLICSNGLIIKDKDLGEFNLRHLGYTFRDLQNLMQTVVENLPKMVRRINDFSEKVMTPDERRLFATKAIQARFGEEKVVSSSEIDQVLSISRSQDEGNNLWVTLNTVQESLIRGGFISINSKNKERKVRGIKNMFKDLSLNERLWEVAGEFC